MPVSHEADRANNAAPIVGAPIVVARNDAFPVIEKAVDDVCSRCGQPIPPTNSGTVRARGQPIRLCHSTSRSTMCVRPGLEMAAALSTAPRYVAAEGSKTIVPPVWTG